jgi:hypothetical protein
MGYKCIRITIRSGFDASGYQTNIVKLCILAVDMVASIVMTTVGKGRELGLDPSQQVSANRP